MNTERIAEHLRENGATREMVTKWAQAARRWAGYVETIPNGEGDAHQLRCLAVFAEVGARIRDGEQT